MKKNSGMKKILCLLVLTGVFFVCACSRTEKPAQQEGPQNNEEIESFIITEQPAMEFGVILTDASLLELRDDGKMYWKASINAGDTVGWKNEEKSAVRAYDGLTRTFYLVDADGDYWVQDYAIAGPAIPAVIVADETILYTKPDLTSVARRGAITVPKYALVAMLADDTSTGQFVKISARVEGSANPSISELYVKIENISSDYNDIGCVKLARIASGTRNPAARKELLKNAMELAYKGKRLNQTPAGLSDDPALFELELTDNLERLDGQVNYVVTTERVNMRDMPSLDSNVAGTMTQGDDFWVSFRTRREISLPVAEEGAEPVKGRWLRTESGLWVFSGYAAPNQTY
ncbi:MAG: hypothetical protein LBB72_02915 [Spirochaetaceae bacterium]|jgi:hypothetical protein|nr:hypothetical protein [Spirochaetaceae bacterium]